MNSKSLGIVLSLSLATLAGCSDEPEPTVSEGTEAEPTADADVARAMVERRTWGLSADRASVEALLASGRDVGTEQWGIPMTDEEHAALDLTGRMDFASEIKLAAVPFINALAASGGVYLDQERDGELVVLLTETSDEIEAAIAARMPASSRGFRIATVTHSEADLRGALQRAWDVWDQVAPGTKLQGAGLDIRENRVLFEVDAVDLDAVAGVAGALEAAMGVRVGVEARVDQENADTSCTSRDHCVSPSRAGTRIYKGFIDNFNECTMAFHVITNGGDVEFVTAGHCGYGGSNNWYLKDGTGDGLFLGSEQKSLYKHDGQDIMRVNLPLAQQSHRIYGETRVYGGSGACPITGQVACASRGKSNVVDCGTVRTTWTSWWSNTASPDVRVWGGDLNNVDSNPGDSGSPVFDRLNADEWGTVGVLDTASGGFAVLCKAEAGLEITGKAY
jgi:hypothetical protein